jgi:hypothetical protein
LTARHDALAKRSTSKLAFTDVVVRLGREETPYTLMMSQVFNETEPPDCKLDKGF